MSALDNLSQHQFPLYHGSDHEIDVGDTIRPGARPSNYPGKWGTSEHAYATAHPTEAMLHGDHRYLVEPVDHEDVQPDPREPHAYTSTAGYRVVQHLSTDDMREHIKTYRGR
jgi:hypothetical protein